VGLPNAWPGEVSLKIQCITVDAHNPRTLAEFWAEAEGDLSGDDFRESHFNFWSQLGLMITGETEIVLVYFDLIEDLRHSN
jgi:uncharacterized protein YhfF